MIQAIPFRSLPLRDSDSRFPQRNCVVGSDNPDGLLRSVPDGQSIGPARRSVRMEVRGECAIRARCVQAGPAQALRPRSNLARRLGSIPSRNYTAKWVMRPPEAISRLSKELCPYAFLQFASSQRVVSADVGTRKRTKTPTNQQRGAPLWAERTPRSGRRPRQNDCKMNKLLEICPLT
jgi:hypothetical protein